MQDIHSLPIQLHQTTPLIIDITRQGNRNNNEKSLDITLVNCFQKLSSATKKKNYPFLLEL
jgi:hypothetical protein